MQDWNPKHRVDRWREEFGRHITGAEVETLGAAESSFLVDMRLLRGRSAAMTHSRFADVRQHRSPRCLADGDDAVTFMISRRGTTSWSHQGRQGVLRPGEVALFSHARPIDVAWRNAGILTMLLPRAAIVPLLDPDHFAGRVRSATAPAVRLLSAYASTAFATGLPQVAEGHFPALIADILADEDTPRQPPEREAARRAARLHRIEKLVATAALAGDVGVDVVGQALGVSGRTVQRDLAEAGTSLRDLITAARLDAVGRCLAATDETRTISQLAFEAGFNDLSHFNRAFRARFGETPRDVRERTRCSCKAADSGAGQSSGAGPGPV